MIVCAHCGLDRGAMRRASITTIPGQRLAEADEGLGFCCAGGDPARFLAAVRGPAPVRRPAGREVKLPDARRDVAAAAREVEAALGRLAALARERGWVGADRDPALLDAAAAAEDAAVHLARHVWDLDPQGVGRITWWADPRTILAMERR